MNKSKEMKGVLSTRYPTLKIDIRKIKQNTQILVEKCKKNNISVVAVTKSICAIPEVASAMVEAGASAIGDSRMKNIISLEDIKVPKILLRLPALSEINDVLDFVDVSLNSEYITIKALSSRALELGKIHKIIIMVDLGDLREGLWPDQVLDFIGNIINFKGIEIIGLGTTLTCYGGVLPTRANLGQLVYLANEINNIYGLKLEILSGGNSSSLYLIENSEMPKEINQLRLGEALLFGRETAFGGKIDSTFDDAFSFITEIIEIKNKPSYPVGEFGIDGFGQQPKHLDIGIRKRAIVAAGRQDFKIGTIFPKDKKIKIVGACSDHMILDITDSNNNFEIGDKIEFFMNLEGLLSISTSQYVSKLLF